jgi:myo-inositol-1-phosphate synthase
MASFLNMDSAFKVEAPGVQYKDDCILADYTYETTVVEGNIVKPVSTKMQFKTETKVPRTGVLLVGLGGNNGSTCVAGALANKLKLSWETKEGMQKANYWGSMVLASTAKVGNDAQGNSVYTPLTNMLPMCKPDDLVWGGWDISGANLGDAMKRAKVLDVTLQKELYKYMKDIVPMPSVYFPDFIAANQCDRADNVLQGTPQEQLEIIRQNIRDFRKDNSLDRVGCQIRHVQRSG